MARRTSSRHTEGLALTPAQRAILDQLRHTRGSPIPMARLVTALYGGRWDGGPDSAENCVRVQLFRLRGKLARHGITILAVGRGRASLGYMIEPKHLQKTEEVLAGLPATDTEEARQKAVVRDAVKPFAHLLCPECYAAVRQAQRGSVPASHASHLAGVECASSPIRPTGDTPCS